MKVIKVYLSGPMYKSFEESAGWRDEVSNYLKSWIFDEISFKILNPCDRWYENKDNLDRDSAWVVKMDKDEIAASDVVIVNGTDPGWGTPMEQYIAYASNKIVIAFANCQHASIWVKEHCHVLLSDHLAAARWLCRHAKEIAKRN